MNDTTARIVSPAALAPRVLSRSATARPGTSAARFDWPVAGGTVRIAIKRSIDVTIASVMLTLLAAPMALVALIVRLTSPGPIFYKQERVGLNGRVFVLWKFRTMRLDAERETGPVWAKRNDPRRTLVGTVLRRLCIDELPQLFNVLRGDMSLVGPRPERPCFVEKFTTEMPDYPRRHAVLPGLSGWAQLNGLRGDTSITERLQYDLYYVRNWSCLFDLYILLLTPLRVLVDKNSC
jgi:exopolysaccharide biosynthesis polyprenyl glycosylphosphotransferase